MKRVQPSDIPAAANALSGAIGGAVGTLAVFPMDLIVTRLQVQPKDHQTYRGIWDAFKQIYEQEGIAGFYRGATDDTAATMVSAFLYFYAYEYMRGKRLDVAAAKKASGRRPATLGVAEELLVGTLAGMFCKFVTSPINNVVTRKQVDTHKSGAAPSTADILRQIHAEKGLTGFWTGYRATVLISVNPALTYYFFQVLRALLIPRKRRDNPTSVEMFFLSAFAKTLATLITYPAMMVKTRQQVAKKGSKVGGKDKGKDKVTETTDPDVSLLHLASTIYQTQGFGGLYQGARAQILRSFFSQGITMMTKDQIAKTIIYIYFAYMVNRGPSLVPRALYLATKG